MLLAVTVLLSKMASVRTEKKGISVTWVSLVIEGGDRCFAMLGLSAFPSSQNSTIEVTDQTVTFSK